MPLARPTWSRSVDLWVRVTAEACQCCLSCHMTATALRWRCLTATSVTDLAQGQWLRQGMIT